MLDKVGQLYQLITEISKVNPMVAGAISLWGLTVFTYVLRNVPYRIYSFILRQVTTTLTLNNCDSIYYDLLSWVTKNKMSRLVRTLNFNNSSRYGWGEASLTVGYGILPFIHSRRLMIMKRVEKEANQTSDAKEQINITMFGRKREIFDKLFEDIRKKNEDSNYTKIYRWNQGAWTLMCRQYRRGLNTVILPKSTRDRLVRHVDRFVSDKEWSIKNGIPWRTGIFLYGPPGTGKTSLIKAICANYERDLYILDLSCMVDTSLREALSAVPENGVVALEDIDTFDFGPREEKSKKKDSDPLKGMLTLSGLLNAIDGVASGEGRILVATTNFPDRLDKALIRDGRFDLRMEIGYLTDESLRNYMGRMYPDFIGIDRYRVKSDVAPCTLQRLVLENRDSPEYVLSVVAYLDQETVK